MSIRGGLIAVGMTAVLGVACSSLAQCAEWVSTGASYPAYLANDRIGALVCMDHDGDGPLPTMLYAHTTTYSGGNNGNFASSHFVSRSLEGGTALGPPLVPQENGYYVLHALPEPTAGFTKGTLIIAGRFRSTDGTVVNLCAWDGITLRNIGGPSAAFAAEEPTSVTSGDPDGDGPMPRCIVIGGQFQSFRGVPAHCVAAWDGQRWQELGEGLGTYWASVFTLDVDGPGPGAEEVFALSRSAFNEPTLTYRNTDIGWVEAWRDFVGVPVWHDPDGAGPASGSLRTPTTRWNGTRWEALQESWPTDFPGGPGVIRSIDLDGDGPRPPQLVTYGLWIGPGATSWKRFAVLGPTGWYFPPGILNNSTSTNPTYASYGLRAGFVHDPDGVGPRGNEFVMITAGPGSPGAPNYANGGSFACWDGATLRTYRSGFQMYTGESGSQTQVWSMFAHDPDGTGPETKRLYANGAFRDVWGQSAAGLAVYRDGAWRGLGDTAGFFYTRWLVEHDHDGDPGTTPWLVGMKQPDALFSGPSLVVRWTGSAWERVGDLFTGTGGIVSSTEVLSACSFDDDGLGPNPPRLFITGSMPLYSVMRLDGDAWTSPGARPSTNLYHLISCDFDGAGAVSPTLYGTSLSNLFRWTGSLWTQVSSLVSVDNPNYRWNSVLFDPDGSGPRGQELVVTGQTVRTTQGTFSGAAGYDGTTWRAIGPANPPNFPVQAFRSAWVIDVDGPGPDPEELVLCGTASVQWLHRGAWVTIPIIATGARGFEFGVEGPMPNELWFTGAFTEVGGLPASGFARWRLATPVSIDSQPVNQWASRLGDASFAVMASGSSPKYQWRRNGVPISDGVAGAADGGGVVAGARSNVLTIRGVLCADEGTYDCIVQNSCRTTTSVSANLEVFNCCAADLDDDGAFDNGNAPDGAVEGADLLYFLLAFDAGDTAADLDNDGDPTIGVPDGAVTIEDLLFFVAHFEAGC